MDPPDIPPTDSGYPTPRDDIPSSSRSVSPKTPLQLTSTPIRTQGAKPLDFRKHFRGMREEDETENILNMSDIPEKGKHPALKIIRAAIELQSENRVVNRENTTLREQVNELSYQNESLRHQVEESFVSPQNENIVPKLDLNVFDKIKKEVNSSYVQTEPEVDDNKMNLDQKKYVSVMTATATIQVDSPKTDIQDADVQTDAPNEFNTVIYANLKIELEDLNSQLERTKQDKTILEDRLFAYDEVRMKFEENEKKYQKDLENFKAAQKRKEDLEARVKALTKENEQVRTENAVLVEKELKQEKEIEKLSDHIDTISVKNDTLSTEVAHLKKSLDDAAETKRLEEEEKGRMKGEFDDTLANLQLKIEAVKADGLSNEEQLKKALEENEEMRRENKYLAEAKNLLVEQEMELRNQLVELQTSVSSGEMRLKERDHQLHAVEKSNKLAEKDILALKSTIEKMNEDKKDADKLLSQLEKDKLEIDFLRDEVRKLSSGTAEVKLLNEEVEKKMEEIQELKNKYKEHERKENDMTEKIEGLIREAAAKDTEVHWLNEQLKERNGSLEQATSEIKRRDEHIHALNIQAHDYEVWKANATKQYGDDMRERDDKIEALNKALVAATSYPGQNISISKSNQHTQTVIDEMPERVRSESELTHVIDKDRPRSQLSSNNVSLISVDSSQLSQRSENSRIPKIVNKLKEYLALSHNSATSLITAELCRNVIDLLENGTNELNSPVSEASRFWENSSRKIKSIEEEFKRKLARMEERTIEVIKEMDQEMIRQEGRLKDMEKNYNDLTAVYANMNSLDTDYQLLKVENDKLHMVIQKAMQECRELGDENDQLKDRVDAAECASDAQKDENSEWEKECEQLRRRLDNALHKYEELRRKGMDSNGKRDEEVEELRAGMRQSEKEREKLAEDLDVQRKKRGYDKKTIQLHEEASEKLMHKFTMLREKYDREKERLKYVMTKVSEMQRLQSTNGAQRQLLSEISQRVTSSEHGRNVVEVGCSSTSTGSNSVFRQSSSDSRRVLKNRNGQ